jgi:endonuclease/exonuclease/phosphatase family metal-dependent hydrolase
MNGRSIARAVVAASVPLFWLQALRTAFSTLFGIIYDQIFVGPITAWLAISNLALFVALMGPLALGARGPAWLRRGIPAAAAAARVLLALPDPAVRFWASLALLAAGSYFVASGLRREAGRMVGGLVTALCLDQLLRAFGDTFELSFQSGWLPLPLLWSAAVLISSVASEAGDEPAPDRPAGQARVDDVAGVEPRPGSSLRRSEGMAGQGTEPGAAMVGGSPGWLAALGLGGWLFLETSLLSVPNAAARWSGWSYAVLAPALLIATWAPLGWASRQTSAVRYGRWPAVILPLGLMIGYFGAGPAAGAALMLAQATAMLGLVLLAGPVAGSGSGWLAAGGLLTLLANFLNAFAFTYPYTLPQMRGLGWLVYLLAAVPVAFSMLLASSGRLKAAARGGWGRSAWAAAGLATVLVAWAARPMPAAPLPQQRLTLATYNIHYGYEEQWRFTLEEQARLLELSQVDLVALQEVDAGRVTSYLVDDAYFLARRLGMNAAYLPTVEHLTGIAVLYKGPASAVRQRLLTSLQEQTGIVGVELPLDGGTLSAFGVWIGLENEDTLTQVREALDFIGAASPATFAGDFNAVETDLRIQTIRQAGFTDPFELLGLLPAPTHPAQNPNERLDYVWLRGLAPAGACVVDSTASDHRLVVVEAEALP